MSVRQIARFGCLLALLVSTTVLLSAQNEPKMPVGSESKTITGCVHKGNEAGGYYLEDENGKTWELTDSADKVADHVGHKVALTGTSVHENASEEAKRASTEKAEAGGNNYADFRVSSVKMISDSCR